MTTLVEGPLAAGAGRPDTARMNYPQDGGVSALRFYLGSARHPLARFAAAQLRAPFHHSGRLVCQCEEEGAWGLYHNGPWALLSCSCNGSELPVYIGAPPPTAPTARALSVPAPAGPYLKCPGCGEGGHFQAAVAVGYPARVPPIGTVAAEEAQEIVIALRCTRCAAEARVGWALRLEQPPTLRGDEVWLGQIVRCPSRWLK